MGIDQYAYISPLRTTHPGEKSLLAILTMVVVLALDNMVVSGLVLVVVSLLILFPGRVPGRIYLNLLLVPLLFLLIGSASVAVNFQTVPVNLLVACQLGSYWIGFTQASLVNGVDLLLRCLACVACMYFLALTTPMTQVIQVLRKSRLPAVLTEVMSLIYGAIFGFMAAAAEIILAQRSRCGYNNFRASLRSVAANSFQLLVRFLHKSHQSYEALVARGFSGSLPVMEENFCWERKNVISIIGFNLLLVVIKITG